MSPALHGDSVVVASREHTVGHLQEETAILSARDGQYYGLAGVGARLWELIQQPRSVNRIVDALAEEYQVDAETCRRDVLELLSDLIERDLAVLRDEPPA